MGVGNSHFITATKQNTKALVTIDNMAQAPISKTGIAATLSNDIIFDTNFATSGIVTIKSNDIVKIDDEFMRVTSVTGTGTTIFVQRPILGSVIGPHTAGSTIEKFVGNYTITGNTINLLMLHMVIFLWVHQQIHQMKEILQVSLQDPLSMEESLLREV